MINLTLRQPAAVGVGVRRRFAGDKRPHAFLAPRNALAQEFPGQWRASTRRIAQRQH